ncbi:MAG: winged helix-turn-helix transcriptional regulator [Desulfuromonadales bacterium]
MNDKQDQETLRTFQLMNEIENGDAISQRELANRLGIAVGLVNSYLKNLAAKGWIRIKNYPRNRYAYLLTPKGLAEKSRMAYQHLSYFNSLYTVVRQDYLVLFQELKQQGVEKVVFCGVDEVTEIAYLSLREAELELFLVVDEIDDVRFIKYKVRILDNGLSCERLPIILTSLKRGAALQEKLLRLGVDERQIYVPRGRDFF